MLRSAPAVRLALGPLVVFAALTAAGSARAGGFTTDRAGADYGQAAMPNAYAIDINPGALGGVDGTQITLDGSLLYRKINYTRSASALSPSSKAELSNPNYAKGNTGEVGLNNFLFLPALGVVSDLGTKRLRLGFGSYISFGGSVSWDKNNSFLGTNAPGAVDGPQRWSNISSQSLALANTLAGAYKLGAGFSVGVGVTLYYHSVKSLRARNADGTDDMYTATGAFEEGRALLDVSAINFGARAGVYWDVNQDQKLRFGLSYTSQPGFGDTRMSGTLHQQFGTTSVTAPSQNVDFITTLPDIIRLGAAYKVSDRVELRSDLQYERWSVLKQMCVVDPGTNCNTDVLGNDLTGGHILLAIPRQWRDTIRYRVGAGVWVVDSTEIFGSTGFSTGAIPGKTIDPEIYDAFNVFLTAGVRHQFGRHFIGAASYNILYFIPMDVDPGSSVLFRYAAPTKSPAEDGRYTSVLQFLNVNATYLF